MKRWFSSFIGMILVCAITIAQTSISLLPKPQLCKDTGKNFTMGKVKLSTPVLRPEWEVFIMNAGGEIVEHSSSVIEVELVPRCICPWPEKWLNAMRRWKASQRS